MSFSIDKKRLELNLAKLMPFIEKKEDEALHAIEVKATENGLFLSATNGIIGLVIELSDIMISDEFETSVNGKDLYEKVKRLNGKSVTIEVENRNLNDDIFGDLILKSGKSRYKLLEKSYSDFKNMATFPASENKDTLSIPKDELFSGFRKIFPAIDSHNPKQELNGGLIDIRDKKIFLASTDTRQLMTVALMDFDTEDKQLNLPKKSIEEIIKLFEKSENENVDFYHDDEFAIISQDNLQFSTRIYSGKYPNYARIIPSSPEYIFSFNKKSFLDNLRIVELEPDFILKIYKDKLSFESSDKQKTAVSEMELEQNLEFKEEIESISIGLDPNYVKNALKSVVSDEFEFHFTSSSRPVLFKDDGYSAVVMPVTL